MEAGVGAEGIAYRLKADPSQRTLRTAADWPTFNRDLAGTRYSPLDQINTRNVTELQEVWSDRFHPEDGSIEGSEPDGAFPAGHADRG